MCICTYRWYQYIEDLRNAKRSWGRLRVWTLDQILLHKLLSSLRLLTFFYVIIIALALANDEGEDEDMSEMIAFELNSLTSELKELEEKLKVYPCWLTYFAINLQSIFLII